MSETLTERVADMRSQTDEEASVEEIAHSVLVRGDEVFVETLKGREHRFGSIRKIARDSIEEQMKSFQESKDVNVSSDTRRTLEELILSVKQAWDSEINMFRLDYDTNDNGQISNFYIPFDSELIGNPTVFEVYDENGEFVAQDVEDEIGDEIAKIETTDLYVDSIPQDIGRISVYKKTRQTESDLYEDKLSTTTDYDNTGEAVVGWFEGVLASMLIPLFHFVFGLNTFVLVFAFLMAPEFFLKVVPRIITIPLSMIYSMIHAKRNKGMAEKKKFFTAS